MDIAETEIELKKRWKYPYQWSRIQNDEWDKLSRFIYSTSRVDEVLNKAQQIRPDNKDFLNYCLNRWYNFQSAYAVEYIFTSHPLLTKVENTRDRDKDFFINDIPFDHKTTFLPNGYGHTADFVTKRKFDLCSWLYQNQSKGSRYHLKNRLFVVLYNSKGEHWKLKAELSWMQVLILDYLDNFDKTKLIPLDLNGQIVYTDIMYARR